jgi:glycosyltransferase involved in cell wall biosynthesis
VISFITSTWNHEKYIERCIHSVQNQTDSDWEMIILDDGSSDKTGEIARSLSDNRKIFYFYQENIGVGRLHETYNTMMAKSKGEIVAVLEGDDMATPERVENHKFGFAQHPNAVANWGYGLQIDENGKTFGIKIPDPFYVEKWGYVTMPHEEQIVRMLKNCYVISGAMGIKRKALERIGGWKAGEYYTDYPTYLQLILEGEIAFVPRLMMYWGKHANNFTSKRGPQARPDKDALAAYDRYPEKYKKLIGKTHLKLWWKYYIATERMRYHRYSEAVRILLE